MTHAEICIIGGGFSAYCLAKKYPQAEVITSDALPMPHGMKGRPFLEVNKRLNRKAQSWGSVSYALPQGVLHDRCALGGNSEIWGGFLDASSIDISRAIQQFLPEITPCPLAYGDSIFSPSGKLALLLNAHHAVFSAADYFRDAEKVNGWVIALQPDEAGIQVRYLDGQGNLQQRLYARVFLACGVVQTLDLLLYSGMLREGDQIQLSDCGYRLRPYWASEVGEGYYIHFTFLAAFAKWVGIKQAMPHWLMRRGPYCVSQHFFTREEQLTLAVSRLGEQWQFAPVGNMPEGFGQSIHYGSACINGTPIGSYARAISDKLTIIGPVSLPHIAPGPVSQHIIQQVFS